MKKWGLTIFMITIFFFPVSLNAENIIPEPGGKMPELAFPSPSDPGWKKILGLQEDAVGFKLSDLKTDLVLLEVIGVYCPVCFKQAPGFNSLFERINRGKNKDRVAMFGLAAGGTDPEIELLLTSKQYLFPVVSDTRYEIHKQLGEPKTPFIIICRPDGSVLYTHLGFIEDIDGLYAKIKSLLENR